MSIFLNFVFKSGKMVKGHSKTTWTSGQKWQNSVHEVVECPLIIIIHDISSMYHVFWYSACFLIFRQSICYSSVVSYRTLMDMIGLFHHGILNQSGNEGGPIWTCYWLEGKSGWPWHLLKTPRFLNKTLLKLCNGYI